PQHRFLVSPAGGKANDVNEVEPNDTAATANGVTPTPGTELHINGAIGSATDVDFYLFTVSQRTGVFFYVDANEDQISPLHRKLPLFDDSGTNLDSNDNGYDFDTGWPLQDNTASATTRDAGLYRDLNAGNYFIEVSGVNGSQGGYTLKMLEQTDYTNTVPVLNSDPGAPATIFLDFAGLTHTDDWNNGQQYTIPAFDMNNNGN